MKAYISYIIDDNNDEKRCLEVGTTRTTMEANFIKKHLKDFLQRPQCDIYYIKFASVELEDSEEDFVSEFDILAGYEIVTHDDEDVVDEILMRIENDPQTVVIYETSGEEIGERFFQYYLSTSGKTTYFGIPDDDYYFEFMIDFYDKDPAAYEQLVDRFIADKAY